ncbi:MAG: aspartyl protease family protein [Candidatus Vogelbacteria bacterium]|nr:aspartyl protease family protein [Candidatus Vogelbacteria bacterium]
MKFRYARYGRILRPVIPIRITSGKEAVDYQVLVDSGADLCLFSEEVGQAISLDVRSGKQYEVFGVGGKFSVYYLHKVKIEVGGWNYEIEAGFMPEVAGRVMSYGIVGQRGFFDNFVVKFDLLKEEIELKLRK